MNKVVKSCNSKLSGLWKLRKNQRKVKAEGIILPRLLPGGGVPGEEGRYGSSSKCLEQGSKVGATNSEERLVTYRG